MFNSLDALKQALGTRRWPSIPNAVPNVDSLHNAVEALRARSYIQSRETKNIRDSFVTIQDLIMLGVIDEAGIKKIEEIEQRIDDFGIP